MSNQISLIDAIERAIGSWLIQPVLDKLKTLEDKMSALDDAVTAIQTQIDAIGTNLTKATTDIEKAIADLQAAIKNGVDPTGAIAALTDATAKLQTANIALQALDAEAVAADPNPPPPAP